MAKKGKAKVARRKKTSAHDLAILQSIYQSLPSWGKSSFYKNVYSKVKW